MRTCLSIVFSLTMFHALSQQFTPNPGTRILEFDSLDAKILVRAGEVLADSSFWNKKDDRKCQDDISSSNYSLFCALYKASLDVVGSYNHRKAGLQQLRFILQERYPERIDNHRLMNWNNHPETTFEDVRLVLQEALSIIDQSLEENK